MPTWRSPEQLREDPWVVAQVARVVDRRKGTLTEQERAWMTEQLFDILANDAFAAKILLGAHPKIGDESGETAPDASGTFSVDRRGAKG